MCVELQTDDRRVLTGLQTRMERSISDPCPLTDRRLTSHLLDLDQLRRGSHSVDLGTYQLPSLYRQSGKGQGQGYT